MSNKTHLLAYYRDTSVAARYDVDRFCNLLGAIIEREEGRVVEDYFHAHTKDRILEVAAGTGRITVHLPRGHVVALDTSPAMLEQLRVRCPTVETVHGDAFHLPFHSETFNAVVSFRFVRHCARDDRVRFFREVSRVLAPHGILMFDALNSDRAWVGKVCEQLGRHARTLWNTLRKRQRALIPDVYFTRDEISQELGEHGFTIISWHPVLVHYGIAALFDLFTRVWGVRRAVPSCVRWFSTCGLAAVKGNLQWVIIAKKK